MQTVFCVFVIAASIRLVIDYKYESRRYDETRD